MRRCELISRIHVPKTFPFSLDEACQRGNSSGFVVIKFVLSNVISIPLPRLRPNQFF